MARGSCNSLVILAVEAEAGVLDASTGAASAATVATSAVGFTPSAAAVDGLELEAANSLGAAEVEGLTAATGAYDGVIVVRLEAAAADSGAAVDLGATTVAFG